MRGTYHHELGAGVSARVSYSYQPPVPSHDYDQPDDPAFVEIDKVELETNTSVVDITAVLEELCSLDASQLEERIMQHITDR